MSSAPALPPADLAARLARLERRLGRLRLFAAVASVALLGLAALQLHDHFSPLAPSYAGQTFQVVPTAAQGSWDGGIVGTFDNHHDRTELRMYATPDDRASVAVMGVYPHQTALHLGYEQQGLSYYAGHNRRQTLMLWNEEMDSRIELGFKADGAPYFDVVRGGERVLDLFEGAGAATP